ncbi:MAG: hypothetical protein RIR32_1803, partial [Verrucomicrobiota bacterium]
GISRRDALRGVFLGALGLAALSQDTAAKETIGQPEASDAFVPENNYPTFSDEAERKIGGGPFTE